MNEARSEENEKNIVFIIDDQATSRIIMESIARTIDDQIEVMSFDNAISALQALQALQTSKPANLI
ncbi:hypothetical protein N8600_08930 [Gammaproteobacteria bacterium]|nr:hypothetical protein [Gammaproteobacteria bacterium]